MTTKTRQMIAIAAMILGGHLQAIEAQQAPLRGATVIGRVTAQGSGDPIAGALVSIEGTQLRAYSDSTGRFRLIGVGVGPQVLRVQRIGFALRRVDLAIRAGGEIVQDVQLAQSALELPGIQVVADPAGRARGEAGTASVIELEAIRSQVAASLAGVLELVPGVVLQAPGLDNIQQIALRTSPISGGANTLTDGNAENMAAFGTLLVLDGVPLSNNANLQSLGSGAQVAFSSSAGGGIDLRRIPAATIERVEVIRGVPSARWGDLTHGAVIVDTRAGVVEPALAARMDATTTEVSLVGGRELNGRHALTLTSNAARTRTGGGLRNDESLRLSGQLAHRYSSRSSDGERDAEPRLVLDTRIDAYRLTDDRPESPTLPGSARQATDAAFRLLERLQLRLGSSNTLHWTVAWEQGTQNYWSRRNLVRGVEALTTRTEPGREIGRFEGGIYNARVDVVGKPTFFYSRLELSTPLVLGRTTHDVRTGIELRHEANSGSGVAFDILYPPQSQPVGARGFDRPRRFDDVPPYATTGLYVDDRIGWTFANGMWGLIQAGMRVDALQAKGNWTSAPREIVAQPRVNLEFAPSRRLSLRAGAGRLAKAPSLGSLHPALDYYDVVNVNYFPNDPAERLAVLTTFVFDPTNADLGYIVADRVEGGVEVRAGKTLVSLTIYGDRLRGGVGVQPEPSFVMRDNYDLTNVNPGSGQPPEIVEPPSSSDSIPVLIPRPANNISQRGGGVELTADFPEFAPLRTRLSVQGAFARSTLYKDGIEFPSGFFDFQLLPSIPRIPYYASFRRTGERVLLTSRIIHQQPELGLVVTGTIQHTLRERQQNHGATDSLSFEGYLTRGGSLVPVPLADRNLPEYSDLRRVRTVLTSERRGAPDWLFSVQVAKTLPRDGRLSFYAFNAFDRQGQFSSGQALQRLYPATRFGLEVTMPLAGFVP